MMVDRPGTEWRSRRTNGSELERLMSGGGQAENEDDEDDSY